MFLFCEAKAKTASWAISRSCRRRLSKNFERRRQIIRDDNVQANAQAKASDDELWVEGDPCQVTKNPTGLLVGLIQTKFTYVAGRSRFIRK